MKLLMVFLFLVLLIATAEAETVELVIEYNVSERPNTTEPPSFTQNTPNTDPENIPLISKAIVGTVMVAGALIFSLGAFLNNPDELMRIIIGTTVILSIIGIVLGSV